jgi:hypothetical protein
MGERLFDKTLAFSDSIFSNFPKASVTLMLVKFVVWSLPIEGLISARLSFFLKNLKRGDNMDIFAKAAKKILLRYYASDHLI